MRRSFFDVIFNSFGTFISSIWGIVGTWWAMILTLIGLSYGLASILHIPWYQIQYQFNHLKHITVPATILSLIFYYLLIVFHIWQILIINSNICFGQISFFYNLKKAFLKSGKYILSLLSSLLILTVFFVPFIFIASKYPSHRMGYLLTADIINLLLLPFCFTLLMGSILDDIKLKEIFQRFYKLALKNYFRIIFSFVYILLVSIFFYFVSIFSINIFHFLGVLLAALLMILYYTYVACYFTETYFNLDDSELTSTKHEDIEILNMTPIESPKQTIQNPSLDDMRRLGDNIENK